MCRKRGFRYKVISVFYEINNINKCYECAMHSVLSNRDLVFASEMQILISRFRSNLRIPFTSSYANPSCHVSGLSSSSIVKQFTKMAYEWISCLDKLKSLDLSHSFSSSNFLQVHSQSSLP